MPNLNLGNPNENFNKLLDSAYKHREAAQKRNLDLLKEVLKDNREIQKEKRKQSWELQKMSIKNEMDIQKEVNKNSLRNEQQTGREKKLIQTHGINPDMTVTGPSGGFITSASGDAEISSPAKPSNILTQGIGYEPNLNTQGMTYKQPYTQEPYGPKIPKSLVNLDNSRSFIKKQSSENSSNIVDPIKIKKQAYDQLIKKGYSKDEALSFIESHLRS